MAPPESPESEPDRSGRSESSRPDSNRISKTSTSSIDDVKSSASPGRDGPAAPEPTSTGGSEHEAEATSGSSSTPPNAPPHDDTSAPARGFPPPSGLPSEFDARGADVPVEQVGETAVGYAIAAVMNHLRDASGIREPVSPLMLYQLGKKYDAFPADSGQIEGTTLEAALRGLRLHGVCSDARWKRLRLDSLATIPDELAVEAARNRPAEIVRIPLEIPADRPSVCPDSRIA